MTTDFLTEYTEIFPSKNRGMHPFVFLFFVFIVLLGCLFFYDLNYFDYIDEISTVILFAVLLFPSKNKVQVRYKIFLKFCYILLFYIVYSIAIGSNRTFAILLDSLIISKPFVAFFFAYSFDLHFSDKQKMILHWLCIILLFTMLIYWAVTPKVYNTIPGTLFCGSRLGNIAFLLSVLLLICSKQSYKSWFLFFLFLSFGWLRLTTKFAILYCFSPLLLFFLKTNKRKSFLLPVICIAAGIFLVFYVAQEDINFFFIEGAEREFARPVLYRTSWQIINDYIPFGSGFASFATSTSGNFYSSIYEKYGISHVYGIQEGFIWFLSDTFFPALAEFGYFGIVLFFSFFYRVFQKFKICYRYARNVFPEYYAGTILLAFFAIESVADATLISNRGFVGMFLLGIILSEMESSKKDSEETIKQERGQEHHECIIAQ